MVQCLEAIGCQTERIASDQLSSRALRPDWLLIVLAGVLANSISLNLAGLPDPEQNKAYFEHQQRNADPKECGAKLRALGYKIAPQGREAADGEIQQRDYSDLCQQIRMAVAAENSALSAKNQEIIAVRSLILVLVATMAMGVAAWFAWQASIDTRRQANVAENTFRNLERPILHLEAISLSKFHSHPDPPLESGAAGIARDLAYIFKNYGRSGCLIEAVCVEHYIGTNLPMPCPDFQHEQPSSGFVAPNAQYGNAFRDKERRTRYPIDSEQRKKLLAAPQVVVFTGQDDWWYFFIYRFVRYRDMAGGVWTTRFAYALQLNSRLEGKEAIPMADPRHWEETYLPPQN